MLSMKLQTLKPNKSSVLTILAALIIISLLAVGIVKLEQNRKHDQAVQAQKQAAQTTAINNGKAQLAAYQRQAEGYKSKQVQLCSYLNQLTTAKATKGLVTVPYLACQPV